MGYKKDYLNSTETMQILFLDAMTLNLDEMIQDWTKRGTFDTKDEESLRNARIYINNFLSNVYNSLDKKEKDKIMKKLKSNQICMYDVHQLNMLENRKKKAQERYYLSYDEFCDIAEQIMDVRCNKCEKHWKECSLYNILDRNNAPESGFCFGKCKYAYFI